MKMAEVPPSGCVVSVNYMVNPSTFWVTEPSGPNPTNAREELHSREEILQRHCKRSSYGVQRPNYLPEIGEMVAVNDSGTGRWHRAEVVEIIHQCSGYVYDVFLVDHGRPIKVRSPAIRELPAGWSNLDFQAFEVVLYGIIPVTLEMNFDEMQMKTKTANNWTVAAVKFVKQLLKESSKTWLTHYKNCKKKIYGDLYLMLDTGPINLSNELCSKGYAMRSEELFEEALMEHEDSKLPLFGKMTSLQSPGCTDDGSLSTSSISSLDDIMEHRHMRDYVNDLKNNQQKKMETKFAQIEEWRKQNDLDLESGARFQEEMDIDEEAPVGRGTSVKRRKEFSPGSHSKSLASKCVLVESNSNVDEQKKTSSLLDLFNFTDAPSNHESISKRKLVSTEMNESNSANSLDLQFLPAGVCGDAYNKNLKTKLNEKTASFVPGNKSQVNGTFHKNKMYSKPTKVLPSEIDSVPVVTEVVETQSEGKDIQKNNQTSSSIIINAESSNSSLKEKLNRPLPLQSLVEEERKVTSTINCVNDNTDLQHDTDHKTSSPRKTVLQSVLSRMADAQAKQQTTNENVKKNSSSNCAPDMKTRLPHVALTSPTLSDRFGNASAEPSHENSLTSKDRAVQPLLQASSMARKSKVAERLQTSWMLVHSAMDSRPIHSVAEANFHNEIHKALPKLNFKDPMRTQMYAWPAISRGQSTILVGPPRSGKSLAFIVPLVSFMLTPDIYSEVFDGWRTQSQLASKKHEGLEKVRLGNGPIVLILCSGSKSAQFIYKKCCELLDLIDEPGVRVQVAYGGGRERELTAPLVNGCEILITTPPCFVRLLHYSRLISNVDYLAHLILDEVDVLARKFYPEVKEIIEECKKMLIRRAKVELPVQVIATSEKWCPAVEQFAQHVSQNFVICINSYLEAAVYTKLRPVPHFINASTRVKKVLDILDGNQGLFKTVILCQSADEVDELVPFLKSMCIQVLAAHEDMSHSYNNQIQEQWKNSVVSGAHPVLVCTDDVLPELFVDDAMWLIHYSLPKTKTGFGFRFSCLKKNYRNMFHQLDENDKNPDCMIHIFVDKDQNVKELPEVIRFLKRLSVPVPSEIEDIAKEFLREKERQKIGAPLCNNVKAFGECSKSTLCQNRHVIVNDIDRPTNIPICGEVKVKILHVHDASYFSARILEHTDSGGQSVTVHDDYFAINMAVHSHYSDEKNRGFHGIPKLGDICALESKINFFQRVEVIEVTEENTSGVPEELKVRYLDEGTCTVVKTYQLLALPKELQLLPPQVVDIFLCHVLPCDKDTHWSETASCRISDWIQKINNEEQNGKFLLGKVVLSLGNTLWLDPLECRSHLTKVDTLVVEASLRKDLLKSNLAVDNSDHLNKLYELCRAGGLDVSCYNKKTTTAKKTSPKIKVAPSPQWAFLHTENLENVVFICANSPDEFFIRQHKFHDSYQRLFSELQKCDKTKQEDFQLKENSCCIGKFPVDGLWYRAQVHRMLEDGHVSLFFVDYGDYASVSMDDIAPISEKLITKLPFQAVECALIGVNPVDGEIWSEDATDFIYDFMDNCTSPLVMVCDAMKAANCTGGKKYNVVLVDRSNGECVLLNKVLIEKNLAVPNDRTQELEKLNLVHVEDSQISDENDVESEAHEDSDKTDEESETPVLQVSDLNKSTSLEENGAINDYESDYDGFDVQIDNVGDFLQDMLGLKPSLAPLLPALPSSNPTVDVEHTSLSSQDLSDYEETADVDFVPHLIFATRKPQVLWYQEESNISIKINIADVHKYHLCVDETCLQFSTEAGGHVYEVTFDLYGPINISSFTHVAKGFFVQINMKKVVTGPWPHLLASQYKPPWLKVDIEKLACAADVGDDYIKARCDKAVEEISSLEKTRETTSIAYENIMPDDLSSDSDSSSDIVEYGDGPYDPQDPLN